MRELVLKKQPILDMLRSELEFRDLAPADDRRRIMQGVTTGGRHHAGR